MRGVSTHPIADYLSLLQLVAVSYVEVQGFWLLSVKSKTRR
jgi:hypothetical protein